MLKVWNTLKSMRFAIILLLVLVAASLVNLFAGEFIAPLPEGMDPLTGYQQVYGETRGVILWVLQMHNPYHSWWYTVMLALLLLSLLACVIDRTPRVYRLAFRPAFISDPERLRELKPNRTLKGDGADLEAVLQRSGYRVWREDRDGVRLLDAERHPWVHIGPWLVHVGFVLLILGGAMIARHSYRTQVGGLPGDLLMPDEAEWGFNVRVDDFEIKYHPLDEGQWVEIDGADIGRIVRTHGDGTFDVDVVSPAQRQLAGVAAERISNRIDRRFSGSRLDQPNISDYIATLTVIEGGRSVRTERVEVNHPLRYGGYRFYQSSFDDRHTDREGHWTTILRVRRDRGSGFVWGGIAMVTLGLVMGLYFTPRRVVARVETTGGTNTLLVAGLCPRNSALFEEEFNRIVANFKSRKRK